MDSSQVDAPRGAGVEGAPGSLEILSSFRLKARLTVFVTVLVVALCGMIVLLVTRIFDEMRPTLRQDLEWKAERGAAELSQGAELGILLRDEALVRKAFGDYRASRDIVAIVAVDAAGRAVAVHGTPPEPTEALFRGAPGRVRDEAGALVAWGEASVEGKVVGRVAVVVSTARLAAGDAFRRDILRTAMLGGVVGLLLSVFFVQFYIGPLVRLTERALASLRRSQGEFAARERLEKELEIGARIQTSILPAQLAVPGLEMAASMLTASEVGGDYYDVIPTADGAFIGVGDVAGHGLTAGLVMLMVQSAIAALTRQHREALPSEILGVANEVIFDNVRHRLRQDEHVTLSLLRYHQDGRITFAGAHEEMIVFRAATQTVELIETPGTWIGARRDIRSVTVNGALTLHQGDLLVLYTDGITEAQDEARQMFGLERVSAIVAENSREPAETIRARILEAVERWSPRRDDDRTVLVLRQRGPAAPAAEERSKRE
jgi:serine phosphatase RsbU (regulator of sigma subunit)